MRVEAASGPSSSSAISVLLHEAEQEPVFQLYVCEFAIVRETESPPFPLFLQRIANII
jgi:hypothetical protein